MFYSGALIKSTDDADFECYQLTILKNHKKSIRYQKFNIMTFNVINCLNLSLSLYVYVYNILTVF